MNKVNRLWHLALRQGQELPLACRKATAESCRLLQNHHTQCCVSLRCCALSGSRPAGCWRYKLPVQVPFEKKTRKTISGWDVTRRCWLRRYIQAHPCSKSWSLQHQRMEQSTHKRPSQALCAGKILWIVIPKGNETSGETEAGGSYTTCPSLSSSNGAVQVQCDQVFWVLTWAQLTNSKLLWLRRLAGCTHLNL